MKRSVFECQVRTAERELYQATAETRFDAWEFINNFNTDIIKDIFSAAGSK